MYKYHTILINGHDLYKECRLIPTSKPIVKPPEVKTEYVDLPNEDGSLDYTDSLGYWVPDQSLVKFKDRQGSWEFLVNPDEMAWATMYEKLTQIVTGGKTTVILTDDFFHKWEGRVWINDIKTNEHDNRVTLNYILYPYKKVNSKFTRSIQQDWLWNELFDNTIFYGTFSVDSRYGKWRNLYNPTSEVIYPTIDVAISSANTANRKGTCTINGQAYNLYNGQNNNVPLQPGDNIAYFSLPENSSSIVSMNYNVKGESL